MDVISNNFIDPSLANQFGKDYIKILKSLLLNNNIASRSYLRPYPKNATGNLIRSLNYTIRKTNLGYQTTVTALPYLTYVDRGRKPGTYPPIRPLLAWARVKGLPEGAAYGAQKNIAKGGIRHTHVI